MRGNTHAQIAGARVCERRPDYLIASVAGRRFAERGGPTGYALPLA